MRLLKKLIKGVLILLGLWVVVGAGLVAYGLVGAEERVAAVCESIKPGMSADTLAAFADAHGLSFKRHTPKESDVIYLPERRSGGRFGCRIQIYQELVKEATVYHMD